MKYNEYIERRHYGLVRQRGMSARDEPYGGPAFAERYASHEIHGIVELARLRPGASVLVVGAGTGADACRLADQGFLVTGIDLVQDAIDIARRIAQERGAVVEYHCDDICRTARQYGTYDAVVDSFCSQNIVNDSDRQNALAFVRRHLCEGGRFLMVCAGAKGPEEYDEDYRRDEATGIVYQKAEEAELGLEEVTLVAGKAFVPVRRHHTPESLRKELEAFGFRVVRCEWAGKKSPYLMAIGAP